MLKLEITNSKHLGFDMIHALDGNITNNINNCYKNDKHPNFTAL